MKTLFLCWVASLTALIPLPQDGVRPEYHPFTMPVRLMSWSCEGHTTCYVTVRMDRPGRINLRTIWCQNDQCNAPVVIRLANGQAMAGRVIGVDGDACLAFIKLRAQRRMRGFRPMPVTLVRANEVT